MRATTALLLCSLLANVALGAWWLVRTEPVQTHSGESTASHAAASAVPANAALVRPPAETAASTAAREDPAALRDRLRALGFSEAMVRTAVRGVVESPRLARERALRAAAGGQPWWRSAPAGFTGEQNRELRALQQAERVELDNLLGPAGQVTPAEIDRFAYFPEDKAAQLAVLYRDLREKRRDLRLGAGTRAEMAARDQQLDADHERALAAVLSPEERAQLDYRISNAAHSIGNSAAYFSGTEADYVALFAITKPYLEQINRPHDTATSMINASQDYEKNLQTVLGAERYVEWKHAGQADYTALVELQRRFAVPVATTDAVTALVRAVGDEGMVIAQEKTQTIEQKRQALLELASSARQRVNALLGEDLGTAYTTASASVWLDDLERGVVPFIQANGQRAIFGMGGGWSRTRTVAPKR